MGDIEFNIGEMREHTGRLHDLTTQAQESTETAKTLAVDGLKHYGLFCSPLIVPPLAITEHFHLNALESLADVMEGRSTAMSQTANAYEGTEDMAVQIAEDAVKAAEK